MVHHYREDLPTPPESPRTHPEAPAPSPIAAEKMEPEDEGEEQEVAVPLTMPSALPLGAPGRLYEAQAILELKARWQPSFLVKPGSVLKNRAWWKAVMTDQELDLYDYETMLATQDLEHKGDAIGVDAVIVPRAALEHRNAPLLRAQLWIVEIKVGASIGPSTIGSTACVAWQLAAAAVQRRWMLVCPEESEVQRMLREPHAHGTLFERIEHVKASEQVRQLQRYIRECDVSKARMYELLARVVDTRVGAEALTNVHEEIALDLVQWHARRALTVQLIKHAYESIARARGADATAARLARKRAASALEKIATSDGNDPRWGALEHDLEPLT